MRECERCRDSAEEIHETDFLGSRLQFVCAGCILAAAKDVRCRECGGPVSFEIDDDLIWEQCGRAGCGGAGTPLISIPSNPANPDWNG